MSLPSRALDILVALVSRPGETLSKEELTQIVWRGAVVDETLVRVGISAARKALGEDGKQYIATVPGRGYCFAAGVTQTTSRRSVDALERGPLRPQRLPVQIARVVGREAVVEALAQEVTHRRLLSLVGPGGIGKTTVALAIAERLKDEFDAIAFIDLAMEDGGQMSAGVAAALGLNLRPAARSNSRGLRPRSRERGSCCSWTTANMWSIWPPALLRICSGARPA